MALLTASLTLAGCSGNDDDSVDMASGTAVPAAADAAALETSARGAPGAGAGPGVDAAGTDWGSLGRDVIVELHVQMESDDIARTVAAVSADATNAGGGVASSDIDYGTENAQGEPNRDGHAVIVVKVPPAEVATLLTNLEASGRVTAVNQSAEDVTEQLIDLDVRIDNARQSVENVRGFMEQATNLADLVSLESELTRRQTELEQLEAQQRNLSDRVALSTITIEIRPAPASAGDAAGETDDDTIGDAFRSGWDAFGEVLFGVAFVLAALAPFIVTASVVGFLVWVASRVRRRPRVPGPQPSASRDDELTPV